MMKLNHIFHILSSLATEDNTSQTQAQEPHISSLATKAKRKESPQNTLIGMGSKINLTNH